LRREGLSVTYGPDGESATPQEALKRIIERHPVTDVAIEENDLEDIMRRAYLDEAVRP
jgi:ABC-2 type transport system ATP-binding protein